MRISCIVATLTLALLPRWAGAQAVPPPANAPQPNPAEQAGAAGGGWTGTVDFGLRSTLGDGAFAERVRVSRQKNGWLFDAAADHVGRRDQRYRLDADRPGKITAWFLYDQIPMLLSRTTRTLYNGLGTSALSIDDGLQARVQLNPAAIEPVFDQNSVEFETRTRRRIVEGGFKYLPTPDL